MWRADLLRLRSLRGEALFELGGKLLGLLGGELELAVEGKAHLVGTVILEYRFLQRGGGLRNGRKGDPKVTSCLEGGKDGRGDLLAQGDSQVAGAEQAAEEAFRFDVRDFGDESQAQIARARILFDRGSELDLKGGVAFRDFRGALLTQRANPAFNVQGRHHQAGRGDRGEGGLPQLDALTTSRRPGKLIAKNGGEVLL